jgi:plasmid stability protein
MAAILLENVPDSIHSALKERAEANNRSLDAEALASLEIALRPENSARRNIDRMPNTLSNESLWDARQSVRT